MWRPVRLAPIHRRADVAPAAALLTPRVRSRWVCKLAELQTLQTLQTHGEIHAYYYYYVLLLYVQSAPHSTMFLGEGRQVSTETLS